MHRRQTPSPQLDNMGIIADAFSAQLAEMKQRSEQTDKRMFDGLARMKAMVNEMAEDVSEEQSIADAILLLKEHGYTVIAPNK